MTTARAPRRRLARRRAAWPALLAALLLGACSATRVAYVPQPSDDPRADGKLIEQAVYEQPDDHVPMHFLLTDDFIEFTHRVRSRGVGLGLGFGLGSNVGLGVGTSTGSSRTLVDRLYFNSLRNLTLYHDDDDRYLVELVGGDGEARRLHVRGEQRAKRVLDALAGFRARALAREAAEPPHEDAGD